MIYHRQEKAGELPWQIREAEREQQQWTLAEAEATESLDWRDTITRPDPASDVPTHGTYDASGYPVGVLN
ncbi:MAG: hypothetical protein KDA85_19000, partial [Planctomycetaceae bacterium]|nr:hypothetical protein [Planctomycetaceae bacterium]